MSAETKQANTLDVPKPSFRDVELHGGFKQDLRDTDTHQKHIAERTEWAEQGAPVFCTVEIVGDACAITYYVDGEHTADLAYETEDKVLLSIIATGEVFEKTLDEAMVYVKHLGYSRKSA